MLTGFLFLNAQKHMTRNGYISFFSSTPLEDIEAVNNQVASILDTETGELVFQVLMRSFRFEKKLMEEHFNENYVESEKYPKSTFSGKIINFKDIDLKEDGEYEVNVEGELTIHGVTRNIRETGIVKLENGNISASSVFIVKPEDYDIEIPNVVRENIAKEIEVKVDMKYEKM
jgi:polyisoprenoid-binding protein YceI